jgi:hypothetical protein
MFLLHEGECRIYWDRKGSWHKGRFCSTRNHFQEICFIFKVICWCKTLILPVVLHGCENWSLTLKEEHWLRVFVNRVLRRIFGPKREGVVGGWRRLPKEEFHNLYPLPNTRVYPKVSGLAAWSENCKWYSSLPLGAVVSLSLLLNECLLLLFRYWLSPETFGYTLVILVWSSQGRWNGLGM